MAVVFASAFNACAVKKASDNADMFYYIQECDAYGEKRALAQALLCAACIPYGSSPEDCVAELKEKGFEFEYEIHTAIPGSVPELLDDYCKEDGSVELPMRRQVSMVFSPNVEMFMKTESIPMPVDSEATSAAEGSQILKIWAGGEDLPAGQGEIIGAHVRYFDEQTEEWITWTFVSPDYYNAP